MIATQSAVPSNRQTVSRGVHSQPVPLLAPRSRGFDSTPKRRGAARERLGAYRLPFVVPSALRFPE